MSEISGRGEVFTRVSPSQKQIPRISFSRAGVRAPRRNSPVNSGNVRSASPKQAATAERGNVSGMFVMWIPPKITGMPRSENHSDSRAALVKF